MILKQRPKTAPSRTSLIVRLAVIVVLAGCAWFVWFHDPFDPDRRQAAQFCKSVTPEMSAVAIMQAATAKGATGFATPGPEQLVVYFGKSACGVEMDTEHGSGG